jgi:PAS domain S-box-containing protein
MADRETKDDLARNPGLFRLAFMDHPIPTLILNPDMVVITANHSFLRRYTLPESQVVGQHCYQVFHNNNQPCPPHRCHFNEAMKGLQGCYALHEFMDKQGNQISEEVHLSPVTDERGRVIAVIESIRDISDTRLLETSLKESNEFLNRLLDSLLGMVVAADLDGRILFVNKSVKRILGYQVNDLVGQDLRKITDSSELYRMRTALEQGQGQARGVETYVISKQGEHIPVRTNAATVYRDGQPVATVGIFTDLREKLKMEGTLMQARMQVVQSDKLARLGRMAAGVAHELNNPLTGITVYADLARESLPPDHPVRADLDAIIEDAERCRNIIRGMLDYSRQSEIQVEDLDLNQVVESAFNLTKDHAMFIHVEVVRRYHPEPLMIQGDEQLLRQLFINLVGNALDAMEGRGVLTVTTGLDDDGMRYAEVSDTGPGISDDNLAKVFDPFFTTKEVGKGTGLGLSVVYGVVARHGGRVTVKETGPKGTTFLVKFPAKAPRALRTVAGIYDPFNGSKE